MSAVLAMGAVAAISLARAARRGSRQHPDDEQVDVDAFEAGFERGVSVAAGTDWPDADAEAAEPQAAYESLVGWAFEAQRAGRCYSPWEWTAAQLQRRADPQLAWESYEAGIAAGIDRGARERLGMEMPSLPRVLRTPESEPEAEPPSRHLPAVIPEQRRFLRTGFPWPQDTPVYHGTFAMQPIAREGFRTREAGAPQMMGGRHFKSVSGTLEPRRAAAIALYLDTLGRGARGELGCLGLYDQLEREAPGAAAQTASSIFLSLVAGSTWPEARGRIRETLRYLDDGWRYVPQPPGWDTPRSAVLIEGSDPQSYLLPPEFDHGLGCSEVFPRLLKGVTGLSGYRGGGTFNPIVFGGKDVDALRDVPSWSYGMVEYRVAVPRVCTDFRGAVRLGYLPRFSGRPLWELPKSLQAEANRLIERMRTWYHDCELALEGADTEYDRGRARRGLNDPRVWWSPMHRVGGWTVTQRGTRDPRTTMLFNAGEEEVRVYDPSVIRITRMISMPELRRRYRLGDRVTFPWFDAGAVDVRVWPPGVRRRRVRRP